MSDDNTKHDPNLKMCPDDRAQAQAGENSAGMTTYEFGYTKREHMAVAAMCSILAGNPGITAKAAATRAIDAADLLIKELNK